MIRALLAALLLLGAVRPACAWLREGHMATGAMAFDALERHDPAAVATILRLMRSHPERDRFDRDLGTLAGRERARRTFELMAIWPDAARGGPLDHDDWHYSQTIASSVRHVWPFAAGGADGAFRTNLATLRNPAAADAERALALCWVMHIVGDMHQPLHAAVWLSWRFPLSDAGGNWAWVRAGPAAAPQRLHALWDGAGRSGGLQATTSPDAFVLGLERAHPFEDEPPIPDPVAAFARWTATSRSLAYEVVYQHGTLRPGVSAMDAPVLSEAYGEQVRRVAADQVAAAGNRIGRLLAPLR